MARHFKIKLVYLREVFARDPLLLLALKCMLSAKVVGLVVVCDVYQALCVVLASNGHRNFKILSFATFFIAIVRNLQSDFAQEEP